MGMLNVRLSEEDEERVATLRAKGVQISSLVRRAIRAEAESLSGVPADVDRLLLEMRERYPMKEKATNVDTTDRRAVQRAIRRKLQRRKR
jgi:hypothetical protein